MRTFTVTLVQDGDMLVSHCLELDIASQGRTRTDALENVKEAVALFLEEATEEEVNTRLDQCGSVEKVSIELA